MILGAAVVDGGVGAHGVRPLSLDACRLHGERLGHEGHTPCAPTTDAPIDTYRDLIEAPID